MKKQLYQIAVLFHPTQEELDKGQSTEIVVEVDTVLAASQEEAKMVAAISIPENFQKKLSQLEILVRPF
jgi:hypothetical protein